MSRCQGRRACLLTRHLDTWTPRHLLLTLLALLLPSVARADDYDRWYTIDMAGGRAGWCHATQKTEGDRITTHNELTFKIGRAQAAVAIGIEGEFIETRDAKPLSMKTVMRLGQTPTTMTATFSEREIATTLEQSGTTTNSTHPLPDGKWLTPAAAGDFEKQRFAAGADKVEVRTVDPVGGLDPMAALDPVVITHKDCRKTTLKLGGKDIPVVRCITTVSTQPTVESVEYLDEQGVALQSETKLGGIAMKMTASTREEAVDDKAPGPELMTTTFVAPDKPIKHARSTSHAVYVVSATGEGKLPAFPNTGAQKFSPSSDREARLEIDRNHPTPAPESDATDASFTKPSATINSDDEVVRKLADKAVADLPPSASRAHQAEALRRFTYDFITEKDLGVGFANASETARTRRGDCTEHGVLLAALLRCQGIPSRVACGLVYADGFAGSKNIFGYHMWAQALLDVDGKPTWVDLDGTLDAKHPFDATHIALAVSSLADGQAQDALLAIATIIGRLKIKVESAE